MADIQLQHVRKFYDNGYHAVKDFNLHIRDGEFVVFVGPSGCGKSTTLRMIAGLEEISDGSLQIGGRIVNDLQPKERDIAMVFQNYALYPHMTVRENMGFALTLDKVPKAQIAERVIDAAKMLHLDALLDRKPKELSGGQRQRVALGRAIVRKPHAFLMDEPLSNLDAKLRVEMRASITRLHRKLGVTTVYVTHDQVEAMTMGDRIVVMKDGDIQQVASPLELYAHPANRFVASFIGSPAMGFLDGRLQGGALVGAGFNLPLPPALAAHAAGYDGKPVAAGIRPEHLTLGEHGIDAVVDVVEALGADTMVGLLVGTQAIVARLAPQTQVVPGQRVKLAPDPAHVHLFDGDGGANIGLSAP